MSNQWLRLWHDMPNDPKWRTIARASKQAIGNVIAVYLHVMVNASSNASERGRTHSLCSEDIASALDIETSDVEAILSAMQGRVLDGDCLSGWNKRQPAREDGSAERAKAWRENKKKTHANAYERRENAEKRPDTDTDTDKSSLVQHAARAPAKRADRFSEFWAEYPVKKGRAEAEAKWRARGYDAIADRIIEDVKRRKAADRQWLEGYAPHGSTYINARGWEDEIEPTRLGGAPPGMPSDVDESLWHARAI